MWTDLGLSKTPEAASQTRDAERRRLGLHDLAWLNEGRVHQVEMICGNAWETTGVPPWCGTARVASEAQ
jgi:hypothetical protein